MKKGAVLMVLLLCLTGCAGENKELQRGLSLRTALLKGAGCSFTAQVTADYGDKVYAFSMDCTGDSGGNLTFTVTQPDTLSGIEGTVCDDGGRLTFAETALHFDLMADGLLSPVSAPWLLLKTLRSGCITSAGMDGPLLRLSIDDSYADDALHLDIWCDEENVPVKAEICWENRTLLTLAVINFRIL